MFGGLAMKTPDETPEIDTCAMSAGSLLSRRGEAAKQRQGRQQGVREFSPGKDP
jgi:hypothetical protein